MKDLYRYLLLILVVIILVALSLYLWQKSNQIGQLDQNIINNNQAEFKIEPPVWRSNDPIKTHVATNQSFVEWEVRGYFSKALSYTNNIIQGAFIIDGDASKREFLI